MNINSHLLLEQSIRESSTVVYFTHDYFSNVVDKNEQLKKTAEICKAYNVDKLIAVCPIEFANYYNDDPITNDPCNDEKESQEEAL